MSPAANCLACGGPLADQPALVAPDRMHLVCGAWAVHQCQHCGSGSTLPLVSEAELDAFYPTEYAPFEIPRGPLAAAMASMQRLRDRRFPLAVLRAGGPRQTLLDVGCGRGDLAASWVAAGWRVLGVEPSSSAAATASARGAEILGQTLSTVSLAPQTLDAVVFRHSLEHVIDPSLDLSRVFAALRPGGRLAVIVPNWGSGQRRTFGEYWFPLELPRHRTHFTAEGLRHAIASAGFARIEVRPATPLITTTWSLQFRFFGRILTATGPSLLAGYVASIPIGLVQHGFDALTGDGDFLHAAAVRP